MEWIKSVFSENGSVSMMRLMSLMCCIAAIVIAFVGLSKALPDYSGLSLLCSAFLTAAFGGKIAQKSIETKPSVKPEL